MSEAPPVRLQLYMARCGVGSRRHCEELIRQGDVTVNGDVVTIMGVKVGPGDTVRWRGRALRPEARLIYVALHKPTRTLCANKDERGRALAVDLLRGAVSARVFHVGRLDYLSTGLIFYTNDGEFARIVGHPSSAIRKEYQVDTVQAVSADMLKAYQRGLTVAGVRYRLADFRQVDPRRTILILEEGKNREIREVMGHFGVQLRRIHRTRIGMVSLKGLGPADFRFLSAGEIRWFLRKKQHAPP